MTCCPRKKGEGPAPHWGLVITKRRQSFACFGLNYSVFALFTPRHARCWGCALRDMLRTMLGDAEMRETLRFMFGGVEVTVVCCCLTTNTEGAPMSRGWGRVRLASVGGL